MPLNLYSPDELARRLAGRVRDVRLQAGMSQRELAARAGMSERGYRDFERTGRVSVARLASIATVLGRARDFDSFMTPRPRDSVDSILAGQTERQRAPSRRIRARQRRADEGGQQ